MGETEIKFTGATGADTISFSAAWTAVEVNSELRVVASVGGLNTTGKYSCEFKQKGDSRVQDAIFVPGSSGRRLDCGKQPFGFEIDYITQKSTVTFNILQADGAAVQHHGSGSLDLTCGLPAISRVCSPGPYKSCKDALAAGFAVSIIGETDLRAAITSCEEQGASYITFGNGKDGTRIITSTVMVEDLVTGYDPASGIFPFFEDLIIRDGGRITTNLKNVGVVIAVRGKLTIQSGGAIDANDRGYSGGVSKWGYSGYGSGARDSPGDGPGGGSGGRGGYSCCHGDGGGGGSFRTKGEGGLPDMCRNNNHRTAAGQTQPKPASPYFKPVSSGSIISSHRNNWLTLIIFHSRLE